MGCYMQKHASIFHLNKSCLDSNKEYPSDTEANHCRCDNVVGHLLILRKVVEALNKEKPKAWKLNLVREDQATLLRNHLEQEDS